MKILVEIDKTKEDESKYTTYFYHKYNKFVYKVITNGSTCVASIRKEEGIPKDLNWGTKLPKYILNKI